MALSWNEIKDRAVRFSKEWEHETSEDAEAKSFLDGFFNVFGISRRRMAAFVFEAKRMEFLFELYEKYTAGLFVKEKKRKAVL